MAVKNRRASVLARLKNQAKEDGISYQMALQLFFQEEFLRHLALSKYRDNFVLKGGMFLYVLTEFDSRPTMDMDFLMRSLPNDPASVAEIMREICTVKTENYFAVLEVCEAKQIALEKTYPGVRTKMLGRTDNIKVPFSVDIGIDDIIVPDATLRTFATRLPDFAPLEIRTYSLESTIAEKFDAILTRMETTSRMKDFYDIYYLSGMFDFDGSTLSEAVRCTLTHRGHNIPDNILGRIMAFDKNKFLLTQWSHFSPARGTNLIFSDVLHRLVIFLSPIVEAVFAQETYAGHWDSRTAKWQD